MSKAKLCIIYNFAQHYRTEIFQRLDEEFDCDFYFGDSYLDVKKMDYSLLKGNVTEVKNVRKKFLYYQKGIVPLVFKYDLFLMLGETRSLSTWLFSLLAFILRKDFFFWSHGWYGKESKAESFLKKFFFRLPKGVFVYGNYAKQLMVKKGFDADKIHVIYNSLAYSKQLQTRKNLTRNDVFKNHFKNDFYNLIFVGRLTVVKQLNLILEAMVRLKEKTKPFNLTLIGGGECEASLKKQCHELGLDGNVWFYGPCYEESELGNLIYNADLCVAPGNVGLTAMHTMVFGTPVLTHNDFAYQMPEFEAIKPLKTGIFFERNNVEDLVNKIDEWFAVNGQNRDAIIKNCMDEIDSNWNPNAQIKTFKEVLSK